VYVGHHPNASTSIDVEHVNRFVGTGSERYVCTTNRSDIIRSNPVMELQWDTRPHQRLVFLLGSRCSADRKILSLLSTPIYRSLFHTRDRTDIKFLTRPDLIVGCSVTQIASTIDSTKIYLVWQWVWQLEPIQPGQSRWPRDLIKGKKVKGAMPHLECRQGVLLISVATEPVGG